VNTDNLTDDEVLTLVHVAIIAGDRGLFKRMVLKRNSAEGWKLIVFADANAAAEERVPNARDRLKQLRSRLAKFSDV
jgi:DNA-binding cell septation regulator SpoVG